MAATQCSASVQSTALSRNSQRESRWATFRKKHMLLLNPMLLFSAIAIMCVCSGCSEKHSYVRINDLVVTRPFVQWNEHM